MVFLVRILVCLFLYDISEEAGNRNKTWEHGVDIKHTYGEVSDTSNPRMIADVLYVCNMYTARQYVVKRRGYFFIMLQLNF